MIRVLTVLIVLAALFFDGDRSKGREGNKRYHEKKYEEAARLYQEGIKELRESSDAAVRTGLFNNLGAALNRLESFDEASAAFATAIETAESKAGLSRASYNAGNNAFQAQQPQRALDFYRSALLAEPDNDDARFNYEFVRRLLESQKQSGGSGDNQQQQENQNQEQEQQQQDQQEEQQEQQQEEQQQNQQEEQQQQQQPEEQQEEETDPSEEMTREQAEQILQALQTDEEELMREVWRMKGKPRSVEKDW